MILPKPGFFRFGGHGRGERGLGTGKSLQGSGASGHFVSDADWKEAWGLPQSKMSIFGTTNALFLR